MARDDEQLNYRGLFTDEMVDLIERWSRKYAKAARLDPADLEQELVLKLWSCREAYQPSQMMPLDYERVIKAALYRRILDLIRTEQREKRRQESKNISLSQENEDGEEFLIETTPDLKDMEIQKNLEFHRTLEKVLRAFGEEENRIFDLLMMDFSKTAIAELMGMNRDTVYERIKSIQKKINKAGIGIGLKEKSDS